LISLHLARIAVKSLACYDRQGPQAALASWSIIGWVIRQMPFPVRRKRLGILPFVLSDDQSFRDINAAIDDSI
jgi:hypothetical protein